MLSTPLLRRFKHVAPADGNAAAAYVGYAFTETSFGYPITPSTPAFELVEEWAHAHKRKNAFGEVPTVVMMEHEGGVAGALHGASTTGALTSTYTSSQGLLLMYPNLFKLRYAQVPVVFHVAARAVINTLGTIECDHSDVLSVRSAGSAMLSSASNQDVHDLAAVAHLSAIRSMIPFLHFYDGFRTSHQITNVEFLEYSDFAPLVDQQQLAAFRARAFNPNHPSLRFLAIHSSYHFQVDTAASFAHTKLPEIVEDSMQKISKLTGRPLNLFDYHGAPDAESVIIVMGSTAQNVKEAVDYLNAQGRKYGVITVRLYRPFSVSHLLKAIPASCRVLTALDRVNEAGAPAQPLHSDVCTGLNAAGDPRRVLGGMYGIGGRELTPAQVATVYENSVSKTPRNLFRVGIVDDLGHTSLPVPPEIDMVPKGTKQCIFWGLGSDGTVGANKEAIAIICEKTSLYGQGYFTYDAKKSGGITRSHLRFGSTPITSNYAIQQADYIAVHSPQFPSKYPVTTELKKGGTFVLNCAGTDLASVEKFIPPHIRRELSDRQAKLFVIDATKIAAAAGIPGRINLIMQAVFFKLSDVLGVAEAIALLKQSVEKNYGHQGQKVVDANLSAIDRATEGITKIDIPSVWSTFDATAPSRFANVKATKELHSGVFPIFELKGEAQKPSDFLPVYSHLSTAYFGSSKYEKRGIAINLPVWNPAKCVQCNSCAIGCAHAILRPRLVPKSGGLPSKQFPGYDFVLDISPYDCLGCGVCIERCPAKALSFNRATDELFTELEDRHLKLVATRDIDAIAAADPAVKAKLEEKKFTVEGSQYFTPLLEYSGACGGCHETLYAKLLAQLFGPRLMIANATGCSIIWSAAFPSVPWTTNARGQGPTWGNSLFEDNAEYGLGIYTAFAHRREQLRSAVIETLKRPDVPADFRRAFEDWLAVYMNGDKSLGASNKVNDLFAVSKVPAFLEPIRERRDLFVKPSVWIVGGDGWANDIGYGGLDHVLASGADVKVLVYDNESYANTGFQMSKATPRGAVMKFAATGKDLPKKALPQILMQYPNIYVANCAIAADPRQTVRAMKEAESHVGSAILNCYCPCLGHGVKPSMQNGHGQAKLAVESGYWPLFRRDPNATPKFVMDSKSIKKGALEKFLKNEVRYESLRRIDEKRLVELQGMLQEDINRRWDSLLKLTRD